MRDSKKILKTDPDTDMLQDPGTQFEHPLVLFLSILLDQQGSLNTL